jgi:hypothetical protein
MRLLRPDPDEVNRRARPAAPPPALAEPPPGLAAPSPRRPVPWRLSLPLAAIAVTAPVAVAFGAAWTLPRGTGQAILTTTYSQGSQYLRQDGVSQRVPEYRKAESTALLEYGVTDGITLVAIPSVFAARTGGSTRDTYSGLGYTDLGARARIWSDEAGAISVQALARIPGAQDDRRAAQFGNTDGQVDLRVLAGRGFSLGDTTGYVNFEAAYRTRLDDPPHEWRFDLSLGVRPHPDLTVLAQSFNVISDGEGRGAYPSAWYSKAQLSLLWNLAGPWTLQAGAFTTIAAENALRESGGLLALWRSF